MLTMSTQVMRDSLDPAYANRLRTQEGVWWKRLLDVQRPYRHHLRSLKPGFVLDVGCGLGRNLAHCGGGGGGGGGPPPPPAAVAECRARGFEAYTPEEFEASPHATAAPFETLLISHVLEHMPRADAVALAGRYLPRIRPGGRAIFITPQEAGYRSDPTHVELVDLEGLTAIANAIGLEPVKAYSFPFPRVAGRVFKYNEFVLVAKKR
jgi:2-polyprenyl-3-methyl-5-hydroxy-6-metoxy-1,4-benzoquinol methylase